MDFTVRPEGVYKDSQLICSRLEIVALTRDESSRNWGRLLRWKDPDGVTHSWTMPMELSAKNQELLGPLLNGGLVITPNKQGAVLEYIQTGLPATHIRCVNRTGWQGGGFVLPDVVIQPEVTEPVVYQPSNEIRDSYRVAGTDKEWLTHVGRFCRGNSRLLLAVSCAFAGPVLRLLGEESGGVHIYGPTTTGKSTAAMVAGSVLGGGGKEGFLESWLKTANALEGSAALHNDSCLILDELNLADGKQITGVIYMIANGQGKGRMNSDIELRRNSNWAVTVISTGELTLQQHATAAGGRVRGGSTVRILDISADAGKGLGLFEQIYDSASPAEFSDRLKEASRSHYGAAFRAWIKLLVDYPDTCKDLLREEIQSFEEENKLPDASPEVQRVVHRLAVIAAAGELATISGITGWKKGDATWGCACALNSWIELHGGKGSHDAEAMVRQVRHFLQLHSESRFLPWPTHRLELLSPRNGPVRDCAGYRKDDCFWFHSEVFLNEVCRGYDYIQVCRVLAERGYLDHAPRRYEKQAGVEQLKGQWFYVVKVSILEGGVISNQDNSKTV
jgi:putative DNA primase/helicase